MVRSFSSSHIARVGVLAMVGKTEWSSRNRTPASSIRRNMSSNEAASPAACITSATMPKMMAGSGWISARFSIHGSRGRTQQIASGSTPRASNQMIESVAVLPEPTITYSLAVSSVRTRSLGGITRTSSATPKLGGDSEGMSGAT